MSLVGVGGVGLPPIYWLKLSAVSENTRGTSGVHEQG
jgi:hypothetical protein